MFKLIYHFVKCLSNVMSKAFINCRKVAQRPEHGVYCLKGVARLRKRFINSSGCPWANLARTYGTRAGMHDPRLDHDLPAPGCLYIVFVWGSPLSGDAPVTTAHLLLDNFLDAAWQVAIDSTRNGGDQLLHGSSLLSHDRLPLSFHCLLLLLQPPCHLIISNGTHSAMAVIAADGCRHCLLDRQMHLCHAFEALLVCTATRAAACIPVDGALEMQDVRMSSVSVKL